MPDEAGREGTEAATEVAAKPRRMRRRSEEKQSKRGPESFRDAEYFMPAQRAEEPQLEAERAADAYLRVGAGDKLSKLDQAVMDLVEDEREGAPAAEEGTRRLPQRPRMPAGGCS